MNIVVLGPHRGGTSAVAGVLYHLGVFMGDELMGPGHGNPTGHFEDWEFVRLHDKIIGDWRDPQPDFEPFKEPYTALIEKRDAGHELWGVKDPRMCYVIPHFTEIAHDTKIVSVFRNPGVCADSLVERGGHTLEEACKISTRYRIAQQAAIGKFTQLGSEIPLLGIRYNFLVDNPESAVLAIATFVGLEPTQKAVDFIDPSLRHHRRQK